MARDGITRQVSDRTQKVSYRARASWTTADGTRRHASKTFGTKREAEQWRRQVLAQVDRGEYFEPAPIALADVAARWFAGIERSHADSTLYTYRQTWRHLLADALGHRPIGSITASELQSIYDQLASAYTANTVRMVHKVLRGIYGHARTDGLVRDDPTQGRRLPRDRRETPSVWTAAETRHFIEVTATDPDAPLYALLVTTGLRLGEALALHWDDIDLDARTLTVSKTIQTGPTGLPQLSDRPKTARSNRTVVLPAQAVLALHRQRALADPELPLVFPGYRGGILRPDTARARFRRLCERAGVPRVTPHDLRRTAATLLMERGVHPSVAARQLGHDTATMMSHYLRVSTEMQRQASDALDAVLALPERGRRES